MRSILLFAPLAALLFGSGCSLFQEKKPDNVLDESKYVEFLTELQFLSVLQDMTPNRAYVDSIKTEVYAEFNLTEEEFLESHRYYQRQIVEQQERIKKIQALVDEELLRIQSDSSSVD